MFTMVFGGITLGGRFTGFNLQGRPTTDIPNEVVSAVNATMNLNGQVYTPIWYFGDKDTPEGTNHLVVCKREKDGVSHIVLANVNLPKTNTNGSGATLVSVVDAADLYGSLKAIFDEALGDLLGVKYSSIAFMGEKVVRGMNYYILCQAALSQDSNNPYPAIVEINEFNGKSTLLGVERLGGLGYAFTW